MREFHVILDENQFVALWVALVNHLPSIDDPDILPLPDMLYELLCPKGGPLDGDMINDFTA